MTLARRAATAAALCAVALFTAAALAHESAFLPAAAACYFLPRLRAGLATVAIALAAFALLSFFGWGILLSGVWLFAAQLAQLWAGGGRLKQSAGLAAAALTLAALLFVAVPGICVYLDVIVIAPQYLAAPVALLIALELAAAKNAPAAAPLDPLLLIFFFALTLCTLLAAALLAASVSYPQAIWLAVAGGGIGLAALAAFTAPLLRGGALSALQHIFTLQVPIEQWVASISADAARHERAEDFAAAIMPRFIALPHIVGMQWTLDNGQKNTLGQQHGRPLRLHCPPLFLQLYTRRRASPWDHLNYYLLAKICSEYCLAKLREEQNRADNLSRAVHRTGARLTHDIKNILHAIAALTQSADDALLRRQLPALTKRLEDTLAKLRAPDKAADAAPESAAGWWESAQARYRHQPVQFAPAAMPPDAHLPAALFDMALDNFIANALIKRQTNAAVQIVARLDMANHRPRLQVQDSGGAVPAATAALMFRQPVESATGFGLGLYQVQLEAAKQFRRPALAANQNGKVILELN